MKINSETASQELINPNYFPSFFFFPSAFLSECVRVFVQTAPTPSVKALFCHLQAHIFFLLFFSPHSPLISNLTLISWHWLKIRCTSDVYECVLHWYSTYCPYACTCLCLKSSVCRFVGPYISPYACMLLQEINKPCVRFLSLEI